MGLIDTLFGRRNSSRPQRSAQVAKQRLVEVLVYDHVKVTPDVMEAIRHDISRILSRHLDVDIEQLEITIVRTDRGDRFVANVPVRRGGSRVR